MLLTDINLQAEREQFLRLQGNFASQYRQVFDDTMAQKTVVVIPSLTLDPVILAKVKGIVHYEERLLCLLLLLRMPRTHVIYVTSTVIDPVIIDYYLHLLPGITGDHARQRLHFFNCYDAAPVSLTEKILARPRLINRIKEAIPAGHIAHLACFNVTEFERKLAVQLNIPVYGCDPDLLFWGTKSGSREIFRQCGILMPEGFENLRTEDDIVNALAKLYCRNRDIKKAVIKMNDGFSGEGNAVFPFQNLFAEADAAAQIKQLLPQQLEIVAGDLSYGEFMQKFLFMGGIAEAFVEGEIKSSPSVQCRINPLGKVDIISTHDQLLGGPDDQVFLGGTFPAGKEYNVAVGNIGKKVAEALKEKGVLGRFGLDFLSVKENNTWKHYAIEINLRKGGTTHPYIMLQFLTRGNYNSVSGQYLLPDGNEKFYFFTDNLQHESFKGLLPADLIDIAICNQLHYDSTREEGVMFHMIGALSQFGKLGIICIGSTPERAKTFYKKTWQVLLSTCNAPE